LALFNVDRGGTFLVLLKLKSHNSLLSYHLTSHFGTNFWDLDLLLGSPPLAFMFVTHLVEWNSYLQKNKNYWKEFLFNNHISEMKFLCLVPITIKRWRILPHRLFCCLQFWWESFERFESVLNDSQHHVCSLLRRSAYFLLRNNSYITVDITFYNSKNLF
jgi:hypothetical protein